MNGYLSKPLLNTSYRLLYLILKTSLQDSFINYYSYFTNEAKQISQWSAESIFLIIPLYSLYITLFHAQWNNVPNSLSFIRKNNKAFSLALMGSVFYYVLDF